MCNINYEETRRVYEHEVLRGETSRDLRKLEELLKQHLPAAGNRIDGLAEGGYQCNIHNNWQHWHI